MKDEEKTFRPSYLEKQGSRFQRKMPSEKERNARLWILFAIVLFSLIVVLC